VVGELNGQAVKLSNFNAHFLWQSSPKRGERNVYGVARTLSLEFRDKTNELRPASCNRAASASSIVHRG
jgi:hypothetical protein